jgi:hypothetical protein
MAFPALTHESNDIGISYKFPSCRSAMF